MWVCVWVFVGWMGVCGYWVSVGLYWVDGCVYGCGFVCVGVSGDGRM